MVNLKDFVASNNPGKFQPKPYYSRAGDSLTFFFKDNPSYAVRVDDLLTLYRSIDGEEMVGCEIKGVHCILEKMGDFGVRIRSGKIDLSMLFLAYLGYTRLNDITSG